MAKNAKISTVNRVVLFVGFPAMAVSAADFVYWGYQAIDMPPGHGSRDTAQLIRLFSWTISGTNVVDPSALVVARVLLAAFAIITVGTIGTAIGEAVRTTRADRRGQLLIVTDHVLQDASFWQLGDRGGWVDSGVHTGTVVEVHRRPFEFQGVPVDAAAGVPSLIMKDDATGTLSVRPLGMLYRLAGSAGPSGTVESIHDDMIAAVKVGDETSWIDTEGHTPEGTILEIREEPFEVDGRRVDASKKRPGYVMSRTPDGVRVAVSDALREGSRR